MLYFVFSVTQTTLHPKSALLLLTALNLLNYADRNVLFAVQPMVQSEFHINKAQIGFLPEHPYFYDYLTARELLRYYGRLSGMEAKPLSKKTEAVLERVGLKDAANLQLRKFSKGMLQRVGIAQAILHDPKVVFLDEPMSGLDPMGRREVRNLIEELKSEGKTVFFSTHILADAEALCDRVAIIHLGELRRVGAMSSWRKSL